MIDPAAVFLLIFIVALGLTIVTFAMGAAGVDFSGSGAGHASGDLSASGDLGGVHSAELNGGAHGHGGGHHGINGPSPFNMSTILAFLTWFGGAGYLLTAHFGVATLAAIAISIGAGVVGAAIVFLFLARILLRGQTPYMRDEDYRMEGTIGRLSVGVRGGLTGELVFSRAGTRRVISARSADGQDIEQGAEVVVIQHEGGIAYVRRFEELLAEEPQTAVRN